MFGTFVKQYRYAATVFVFAALAMAQPPMQPSQPSTPPTIDTPRTNPGMGPMNTPNTPEDPMAADKEFVKQASEALSANAELGKLAAEKGSSDAVRDLGRRMASDEAANEELKEAAAKANITVPTETPRSIKKAEDKLSKLTGPNFDKAYAKAIANEQKTCIKSFDRESRSGRVPTLKEYATKTLPRIQENQKAAEQVTAQTETKNGSQSQMK